MELSVSFWYLGLFSCLSSCYCNQELFNWPFHQQANIIEKGITNQENRNVLNANNGFHVRCSIILTAT